MKLPPLGYVPVLIIWGKLRIIPLWFRLLAHDPSNVSKYSLHPPMALCKVET